MPFLLYLVVAMVVLFSVVVEMHALVEPTRHIERAALTEPLPAPSAAVPKAVEAQQPDASKVVINPPDAYQKALTAKPAAVSAKPLCDVEACKAAFFTFTPSDCTYQPIDGPRRICTRGNPPSAATDAAAPATAADAQVAAKCNKDACASSYISFNPADCTYQPLQGPRILCTK